MSIQERIQRAKALAEQAKVQPPSPARADQAKVHAVQAVQDVQTVQAVHAVSAVQTKAVQRRAAELTIAVSVALRVARKLRAERSRHAEARAQVEKALIRDRDERVGALEAQLEEANARVDNVEQLAQAEANSRNAAAAAALREERAAQREAHRRERAAERRRGEAGLRCETLQTEAAMLRALLPKELQAQVPRTPARDRSPKLLWRAAKTQAAGSERRESLFHARARAALALSTDRGPASPTSPSTSPSISAPISASHDAAA